MIFIYRAATSRDAAAPEKAPMSTGHARSSGDNRAPNFSLGEEHCEHLDQACRFARKELYPLSERMERDEWWPEAAFPKIGDNGFFGVTIPEEYGGAGQNPLAAGPLLQGVSPLEHPTA